MTNISNLKNEKQTNTKSGFDVGFGVCFPAVDTSWYVESRRPAPSRNTPNDGLALEALKIRSEDQSSLIQTMFFRTTLLRIALFKTTLFRTALVQIFAKISGGRGGGGHGFLDKIPRRVPYFGFYYFYCIFVNKFSKILPGGSFFIICQ